MKVKKDGGSAFPLLHPYRVSEDGKIHRNDGMTLRDWFAGMALQGLVSFCGSEGFDRGPQNMAVRSFELADEMLKERETNDSAETYAGNDRHKWHTLH